MLEAFTVEALLGLVKRYWLPILLGTIGLVVAGTLAFQHWRIGNLEAARATDQIAIEAAVTANAKNTRAIAEIERQAAADREAVAAAVKRTTTISAKTDAAIQEIQNVPHANDPAGPVFDATGDRLRALDADRN